MLLEVAQAAQEIAHMMTWISRGHLKRETESLSRLPENNAIRTHHVKENRTN